VHQVRLGRPGLRPTAGAPHRAGRIAVLAVAALIASSTSASAQENFTLTSANCPVCDSAQTARWNAVVNDQLGIAGTDTLGRRIGMFPAEKSAEDVRLFWLKNYNTWYPQADFKQTMCGTLKKYFFYDNTGDEADWNLDITPSAAFANIFDDVALRHPPTSAWGGRRVEAEITPDQHFYENPWFSKSRGLSDAARRSQLEGEQMCVYGPWVGDKAHDFKPEIHPSELMWWRSGTSAYLLNMQDDSNRFDNNNDFDLPDPKPHFWRDWAQHPRAARFNIAVSLQGPPLPTTPVTPTAAPPRIELRTDQRLLAPALNTKEGDADDGSEHGLVYNGQLLLQVNEGGAAGSSAEDRRMQVGFSFCRLAGGIAQGRDRLLGYVTVFSKVGVGDQGGEGVHLIRVRRVDPQPAPEAEFLRPAPLVRQLSFPRVTAEPELVRDSLRRITVAGRPRLVADFKVRALPVTGRRAGDSTIASARLTSGPAAGRRLRADGSRAVRLTRQPVLSTRSRLSIRTRSGQRASGSLEAAGPVLAFTSAAPRSATTTADPAAAAAAAGAPGRQLPGARLARSWRANVTPAYAGVRNGVAALDEDSPIAEELTEVLVSRSKTHRRTLFGRARPMPVRWSFRGTDAVTGQPVAVRVDRAPGVTQIGVRRSAGAAASSTIDVTFPATGIYRLTVTARTHDPFGGRASTARTLSNLVLTGTGRATLEAQTLTTLEQLFALAPGQLAASSAAEADPEVQTSRAARTASAVRTLAYAAARDRRVTIDELDPLVRGTRLHAGG
jgi:hypothetical protein